MKSFTKFAAILLAVAITSGKAWSATKGHYVGVNLDHYSTEYDRCGTFCGLFGTPHSDESGDNSGVGAGIEYAYAINSNSKGWFLAPKLSYDYLGSEEYSFKEPENGTSWNSNDVASYSVDHALSIRFDVGYDFDDRFALYMGFGPSVVLGSRTFYDGTTDSFKSYDALFGTVGLSYRITDKVSVKLEIGSYGGGIFEDLTTSISKLGVAYNF